MRFVIVGSVLCVLLSTGSARAKTISELNREMTSFFDKKDYRGVIRVARKLYKRTGKTQLLANIGRCFDLLHDDESALRYYQDYLKKERKPAFRRPVLKRIVEVRARLSLKKREVSFVSNPSGASVWINGVHRPGWVTPFVGWLPFAQTTLLFKKTGHKVHKRTIALKPGPPMTLDQQLLPLARFGSLMVKGRVENCTVWLNGKKRGIAPLKLEKLPVGKHSLKLQRAGYPIWTTTVTIEAGRTQTLVLDYRLLVKQQRKQPGRTDGIRIGAWISLGLGVALLASGTGLQISAKKLDDDANRFLNEQQRLVGSGVVSLEVENEYNRRYNKAQTRQRWALGMFVAGSVVAVTGIVLFFIKPKSEKETLGLSVAPQLSPGNYGIVTTFELDW